MIGRRSGRSLLLSLSEVSTFSLKTKATRTFVHYSTINVIIVSYHPIQYHVGLDDEHLTHRNLDSHFAGEEGVRFHVVGQTCVYLSAITISSTYSTNVILYFYLNVRARPSPPNYLCKNTGGIGHKNYSSPIHPSQKLLGHPTKLFRS